jgi:hypothetical protein
MGYVTCGISFGSCGFHPLPAPPKEEKTMEEVKARILEEIGRIIGKDEPILETIQTMKDENQRLKEAVEWAAVEMLNGNNRWFETSQPGEKYYDWFVRELRRRAGMEGSKL